MNDPMIEALRVSKTFGAVAALTDVSLQVPRGAVLGLLGHNGAGKTTLVNILTTMLPPDGGTARVAGLDVTRDGHAVRGRIGLTGQFASVDEQLPATDNLVLIARLLGAGSRAARARAGELLEVFDLTEAAARPARTYSGGMRRRLDLAASLVGRPEVIFLDEPTTGLDPASRVGMWEIVEQLVAEGTTVLLTTQYLEEADRLADSITVLSRGRVVASGTAAELKAKAGHSAVHLTLRDPQEAPRAVRQLSGAGLPATVGESPGALSVPVRSSAGLATVVRELDHAEVEFTELAFTEPTLDDVYLHLAGHTPATVA
ncbi:daunorubicin/doxorubicin resistance ABC transporter ATP-binding protein DrrA [Streptomyces sp. CS149]|uniref:ATP-binding cassette domain-containing protein n=1 Tax=Streptomyces TaxID=1883 RepID=UPI000D1AC144|nr:ATP-binding cassette domain-containing protein [Streptomyces sp. CS149]MCC8482397.1 ATP-binding cassette domain-containing protein [Streptomyces globisporus]PSK69610.1 daunorubicin/doxorubicin resistance ABC transporter ATP-binding protein DrrA [Streptomyces sp. CS149]